MKRQGVVTLFGALICVFTAAPGAVAQHKPRARDLGVPFDGTTGPLNAITDVKGVEVGHATIIRGEGKLVVGEGPVRTGVTAIFPRGKDSRNAVFAAWHSLNGNGEMTGTAWVEDSGFLIGPMTITNTHSVGVVHDTVIAWELKTWKPGPDDDWWSLPVVAETWDGYLNDVNGFHVKPEHVYQAIENAHAGAVEEGNVGGGTGMVCFDFKGGIGTASRRLSASDGGYTVGVLVQCNFGDRSYLRIAGAPVGAEIPLTAGEEFLNDVPQRDVGSIIVVVATDAPLLPHQLKRLAGRVTLGLGRDGSISSNESGDIFIAFSTANSGAADPHHAVQLTMLPNDMMDPLFEATVQATEEAVINSMVAAETMAGINRQTVRALPHDRLRQVLKKYNRLVETK